MDPKEQEEIVARLADDYAGRLELSDSSGAHETLQRMVSAGASRFGYRADRPEDAGFDACALAPPLARMIDHTALKPETTEDQIRDLCAEARKYCFASVCVNPCHVQLVAEQLRGSAVKVCTVIGFPFGANRTATKRLEARLAIEEGATEIDMVLNVGYLKSGRYDAVEEDIREVVEEAKARRALNANTTPVVKVILETALLTDDEKVIACVLAQNARANFVKTSTGFAKGGATAHDVSLMRRVVGDSMGVKASGGVRSKQDAESMIAHGASRIGASASVEIVKGEIGTQSY